MRQIYHFNILIRTFAPFQIIMVYKILAEINKALLPKYSRKDLTKLSKLDQAIIAYRIWVTKKVLK